MKYCEFCGNFVEDDNAKFCPDCGGPLKDKGEEKEVDNTVSEQPTPYPNKDNNLKKIVKGSSYIAKFRVLITAAIVAIILGVSLITFCYNNLIVSKLDIVELEGTVVTVDVSYNEDGENIYEVGVVYDYEEINYNYSFETNQPKYVVNDTLPIYVLADNPSVASDISPKGFAFIGKIALFFGIIITSAGTLCLLVVAILIIKKIKNKK